VSEHTGAEHRATNKHLNWNLTSTEKKVLLWLAENGPRTGYDLFAKERIVSSSTWVAIRRRLGPGGENQYIAPLTYVKGPLNTTLIEREELEQYHEALQREQEDDLHRVLATSNPREPDPYWLTSLGVGEALGWGANPDRMWKVMSKHGIENEESRFLIDLADAGGTHWSLENMSAYTCEQLASGSWSIDLSPFRLRRLEILVAVRAHPKFARRIAQEMQRKAQAYSDFSQLFISDEVWDKYSANLQKQAEETSSSLLHLVLQIIRHTGAYGLSRESAVSRLIKGVEMPKDKIASARLTPFKTRAEAEKAIDKLVEEGVIFEPKPGTLKAIGVGTEPFDLSLGAT